MSSVAGVTVVVPTLNRGGVLRDCLVDLLAQSWRPLEILVVDQSATQDDEVMRLVAAHPETISYHRVSFRGLPNARNYGWQNARHDALVFVDDDIRCGPELVMRHMEALRIPGTGVVAGGIDEANKPEDAAEPVGQFSSWTAVPHRGFASHGLREVDHGQGCNFATWRHVLRATGGFDETLNVGAALYEELEFCLRAKRLGYRIVFHGEARLLHLAAATGGCRVDQLERYLHSLGHNRGLVIRRHVRWYQEPVALGRLALTAMSYARHYREPKAVLYCARGVVEGLRAGLGEPLCRREPGEVLTGTSEA